MRFYFDPDATILSSDVDGTIIVERESISRCSDVINALARIGFAGGASYGSGLYRLEQLKIMDSVGLPTS